MFLKSLSLHNAIILTGLLFWVSIHKSLGQDQSVSLVGRALEEFSRDPSLRNASWGFHAVGAADGRVIASHNADISLVPASTQKVVTTLTALLMLGSDFRYETLLQYDGIISGNVLEGNVYITGSGDPTLGSSMLHDSLSLDKLYGSWLNALKASGIEKINGSIIADGSAFDDHIIPSSWSWQDVGNYYGAGSHALTVNENLYSVYFEPGRQVGHRARVLRSVPEVPQMTFKNDVRTGPRGSGDKVYIYGAPYMNERWLTGTVPLGQSNFEVKGSIPDPGYFLAGSFSRYLSGNNTPVSGPPYTHLTVPAQKYSQARVTLSRRLSPTLDVIAGRTNMNSVNTYAENLLKTLGRNFGNEASFDAGIRVITDFWQMKDIDTNGMRLQDGSGLSPINNITPRQITLMLQFASRDEALFKSFLPGLPVAAQSGSLATMFTATPSAGILKAKSGFLGNVRAYAGYTTNRNGELIAFTLIVNNYSGTPAAMRRKMEVLMDAITKSQ